MTLAVRDADALVFAADMYGIQFDQLAALTGGDRSARAAAKRWRDLGYAETARLTEGPAWLWVTRAGLAACGREYQARKPALPQLAHIRAVAATRIALEATGAYRQASAFWRCERRIRARHGRGIRQHLPDGEVHWPDSAPVASARRVLGDRGRGHAEDRRPHHRDHAGDPDPHRGLRLPGRRGRGAPEDRQGMPARSTSAPPPR